jgi:hypothetical protein
MLRISASNDWRCSAERIFMRMIDKILFWLFLAFGILASLTGVFALNVAPVLIGLALILAAMLYRHVVTGIRDIKHGLELLRGTLLIKQGGTTNRGDPE